MRAVYRRLLLWTFVCALSAAPSYVLASSRFHDGAMILGVGLFIAAYTAVTSTGRFNRLRRRPFVRRTLYVGYGTRLGLSLLHGLAFLTAWSGGRPWWLVAMVDVWPGIVSVELVQNLLRVEPESFMGTLLATLLQGTLLNLILLAFMVAVYLFQRLFMTPPPQEGPHGFDVVFASAPAPAPVQSRR